MSACAWLIRLGAYVEDNGLGIVTGEQGGYRLDPAHPRDTELAPDVAFVRADRLPSPTSPDYYGRPATRPRSCRRGGVREPVRARHGREGADYLTFGTRLVWVIWPRYKRVDVWRPGDEAPTALGVEDTLDGEDVVPGFTYPIARLFP